MSRNGIEIGIRFRPFCNTFMRELFNGLYSCLDDVAVKEWADRCAVIAIEEGLVEEAKRALEGITKRNANLCNPRGVSAAWDALLRIEAWEETLNANA